MKYNNKLTKSKLALLFGLSYTLSTLPNQASAISLNSFSNTHSHTKDDGAPPGSATDIFTSSENTKPITDEPEPSISDLTNSIKDKTDGGEKKAAAKSSSKAGENAKAGEDANDEDEEKAANQSSKEALAQKSGADKK